ncbi:hypothetical protein V6N13_131117 [Hibiscus sabdariffa]|uniref:Uncharacterized protein n=2 Tax=Hibiscus sabdariffa TaxID=183260 RepID=A0ABR2D7Q3_9ROSI
MELRVDCTREMRKVMGGKRKADMQKKEDSESEEYKKVGNFIGFWVESANQTRQDNLGFYITVVASSYYYQMRDPLSPTLPDPISPSHLYSCDGCF